MDGNKKNAGAGNAQDTGAGNAGVKDTEKTAVFAAFEVSEAQVPALSEETLAAAVSAGLLPAATMDRAPTSGARSFRNECLAVPFKARDTEEPLEHQGMATVHLNEGSVLTREQDAAFREMRALAVDKDADPPATDVSESDTAPAAEAPKKGKSGKPRTWRQYQASERFQRIRGDLMDQLDRQGTVGEHFASLVDDYMELWTTKNLLNDDIRNRGVVCKYNNGGGQSGQKKNDSIAEMLKISNQMLSILSTLGIKADAGEGADDEEL